MRHAALLLTVAVLLAACAARPLPGAGPTPPPLTYAAERAVFQIDNTCSLCLPLRVSEAVPQFTLWGDGRLVFAAADGDLRTVRLEPAAADRLVQQAAFLYDLANDYQLLPATDLPGTFFTVATDRGRKSVAVWGYRMSAPADNPHRAVVQRLQALEQAALALVPAAGDPYRPEAVRVQTWDSGETGATAEWPAELTGSLKGEPAQRAMRLAGPGPARLWRLQGREQRVLVLPALPSPSAWEPDLPDPAAGRVLAAARRIDPNAPWVVAGFLPNYEDAGQSPPRRRPAWVVQAERPGGGSTQVWVDAATFAAFHQEEH